MFWWEMGCDKAQKRILSGAEGVREAPGLPSLNANAGACVSQFPLSSAWIGCSC